MKKWLGLPILVLGTLTLWYFVADGKPENEAPMVDTPSPGDLALEAKPLMTIDGLPPQHPNPQNNSMIPTTRQGISSELQGRFPIHLPTYSGVEQLLLLSNQWVIVVTSNLPEVAQELQKLSANDPNLPLQDVGFLKAQEMWTKSRVAGNLDWYIMRNYIEPVMRKYLVQARENAGERQLDRTDYYEISSLDDEAYSMKQHPTRVTRFIVSRGEEWIAGFDPDYAQYSYLDLPKPMVSGKTYTIQLNNEKSVTFLYDELRSVSRTIKVNQVGYLPDVTHKYAYLGGYLFEFGPMDLSEFEGKDFYAIDANTGNQALVGKITLREKNPRYKGGQQEPMSGEDVYELDLSDLKQPGTYFLSIPGIGRSWPFRVSQDVYGEAFYNAMRGMYAQRCGIALTKEFSAWTRQSCHTEPTYESDCPRFDRDMNTPKNWEAFDVIGATIDYSRSTPGPVFGWHDAADWDKESTHYSPLLAMLTLYEMTPQKFRDGQLHLPYLPDLGVGGSGDGTPDILNEAEFGLKVWSKSLTPEGGVSGLWETWTHPKIDDPKVHYAYGLRMQWTSLLYATAAAQLAHLIKPFNAEKSKIYEEEAIRAYHFGASPKNFQKTFTIPAKTNRGSGTPYTITWEDKEAYHIPYLASAQLRLYILTQDQKYLNGLNERLDMAIKTVKDPNAYSDYFPFLFYGIFNREMDGKIATLLQRKLKSIFIERATWLQSQSAADPYRRAASRLDRALAWGWGVMTNRAKWLLLADHLTPQHNFKDTAAFNADYQLGTNPQGMSWTSGIGFVYPIHFQHAISENDQILDPFPGIQIYGPTDSGWRMISRIWIPKSSDDKNAVDAQGGTICFLPPGNCEGTHIHLPPPLRRYATHPAVLTDQNEFTIAETMAGALFTYGMLMSDDWMPSESLKNRMPRADHLLFGYWYLP